jgi:hypothetical protein
MKTAVEWLAEKYDYAYWMVKRDEISPVLAEEWKKHYLKQAKEMEKEQIIEAYETAMETDIYNEPLKIGKDYFNQTFKSE